jgi:hypothetical protein
VQQLLRDKKMVMAHIFDKVWLDKDDPIHFQGKDNEPISRYLSALHSVQCLCDHVL